MEEYALYKGENLLSIGIIEEIAKERNVKVETIKFYLYPTYQRRCVNSKNRLVLVSLDD